MGPWNRPRGVRVSSKNLDQIRHVALTARAILGLTEIEINMIDLLENRLRAVGIHFHVVDASVIPGEAARAVPEDGRILISREAYDGLHDRNPAQQLLVPHELGHFALRHAASFSRDVSWYGFTSLDDSEVQADHFSHEFTMPVEFVKLCRSLDAVQRVFNVPRSDARIRVEKLRIERAIDW